MRTKRTERKTTPKGTTSKFFTVYSLQLYHGITAGSCCNSEFAVPDLCCTSCTMVSPLVPAAIQNLLCQTCAAPAVHFGIQSMFSLCQSDLVASCPFACKTALPCHTTTQCRIVSCSKIDCNWALNLQITVTNT